MTTPFQNEIIANGGEESTDFQYEMVSQISLTQNTFLTDQALQ
jgi:hypothetical protein